MKEIAASLFDVIALSLPRGLGFGDNPPVGAWLSDDDASCGALTQNGQSGAYGVLIMRRRVDEVWCVLRREDDSFTKDQAMAAIHEALLEKPSPPAPLPPSARRRAPLWDTRNVAPSEIFKALVSPTRRVGAWMLNQLYLALPNPDQNWASDCQTGTFITSGRLTCSRAFANRAFLSRKIVNHQIFVSRTVMAVRPGSKQ